ncbi:hypothetical protein RhiirA4_514573, partial [Rhizophagus irregularis]
IKPVRPKPPRRVIQDHQDPDWDDGYVEPDVGDDPDAPAWDDQSYLDDIDLIMGRGTSKRLTRKVVFGFAQFEVQKKVDSGKGVSISKLLKSAPSKTVKVTPIKIPAKVTGSKPIPAKAVTKIDLLSLLRSADFRKLLREILQEELKFASKNMEISEDQGQEEDIREDDPMDIDITRLENTKDLLALGGEVNGISIQCLADTCANASFIQRTAAEELGLVIDKSITHNISSAPGSGRTYGMVKGVSIKLTPDCVITEDLAVLDGYKYREIGLS